MFETSVVRTRAQAARGRLSLLTVSVFAHSAVIVGAVAVSVASVDFPKAAPDAYEDAPVFMPVTIPPPLGNPNAGRPPEPQPQREATPPPPQPNQVTAPTQVPETITPVDTPTVPGTGESSGPSSGTETGPIGVPWGKEGSIGDLDAPPIVDAGPPVAEKIYEVHEVKAPVLLHKVVPPYPEIFRRAALKSMVVVRCVIDKNGRVRDPEILLSGRKPFDDAVLEAVQQWRYTPGSRNGVAVETYLNVTVHFSVQR